MTFFNPNYNIPFLQFSGGGGGGEGSPGGAFRPGERTALQAFALVVMLMVGVKGDST